MPRSRFALSALNGATPGLSRLAQQLAGGGGAYQSGYDGEMMGQSKMAQALAAARASDASARNSDAAARFNDEKAASEGAGRRVLESRPDLFEEQVAAASGTDIPLVQALRTQLRTGQAPQASMGPPTEDGQMGTAPMRIDPAMSSKITAALQQLLPLLSNTGDLKPTDLADARATDRTSALSDAIIAGTANRNTVAGAQAAAAGKNQYNSDTTGAVLDLFGGQLDTANPMAQGTLTLRKEQAGAQKANAVQSYASAGASNASRDKTRAEIAEARTGVGKGGKAPSGYRWNGDALEAIPGGPADPATKGAKLAKPPSEGQAKALMFGSRMAVANEILGELDKEGVRDPGRIKQAAETVPLVGGALAMGVNMLPGALGGPSEGQQRVEQAHRDFVNAVLRRESGAVISEGEFRNAARQYFAQPGDSLAVRRQKEANRLTAISGMRAEFGEQGEPDFDRIVSEARGNRKPANRGVTVDY